MDSLSEHHEFTADKVSGAYSQVFLMSLCIEVIRIHDQLNRYPFKFWAATIDIRTNRMDEWIRTEYFDAEAKKVLSDIKKEGLDYFVQLRDILATLHKEFCQSSRRLFQSLPTLSDQDLLKQYEQFNKDYFHHYGVGCDTFVYETGISDLFVSLLQKQYRNATEVVQTALKSNYVSFMFEAERFLHKVANSASEDRDQLIQQYLNQFYYVEANYRYVPSVDESTIQSKLQNLPPLHERRLPAVEFSHTDEEKLIAELLKQTEAIRDLRKAINLIGSYTLSRFLDEAEKRTGIARELLLRAHWFEYKELFKNKDAIINRLKSREFVTAVMLDGTCYYQDGMHIKDRTSAKLENNQLNGTPAAKGYYQGTARIILGSDQFKKIQPGDVLVAQMTRPDYMPIIRLAGAIITDEGGLTCHAAIVSRELNIPCIVGTKIATKVFKDGDLVEVDADKGVVRKLSQ